jgi:aryl-alcohol dehydrogenase-like predicted oxidoreductase
MRYRLLGSSGLRVSELCLGTMTFGEEWGWGAPRDECGRIFEAFAASGGNFIDTANNYTEGTSERLVGEFIAADRERFVVATKYSLSTRRGDPNAGGNHRKNMIQAVEASLRRLGTAYVDVLYLHMWDYTTPFEEVARSFDDLVRSGKVLHPAFSDTPEWIVAQAVATASLRGWARPAAVQILYSLAVRDAERGLLPMAEANGIGVTAWGVLDQGGLTGRYTRDHPGPSTRGETFAETVLVLAEGVAAAAHELERPVPQVAINWARAHGVIPIVGARTQAQLTENLGCLEWTLPPEILARLDELSRIRLGFPHGWLQSDGVRDLISGGTDAQMIPR